MTNMTATRHPDFSSLCILPNGEHVTVGAAEAAGYTVSAKTAPRSPTRSVAAPAPALRNMTFRQLVQALPEARDRQAAAEALADNHSLDTLSLKSASALLRGLPIETQDTTMTNTVTKLSVADYTMFKRRADLRIAALHQTGSEASIAEAKKIQMGVRITSDTGASFGVAFKSVGLDAEATIRKILGAVN